MKYHDSFFKVIEELPWTLLTDVIAEKLEAQGVKVSKKKRKEISLELQKGSFEKIPIRNWKFWDKSNVTISITEDDFTNIDHRLEEFYKKVPDLTIKLVEEIAPKLSKSLLKKADKATKIERKNDEVFRKHNWSIWKTPFTMLYLLVDIASRAGENAISFSNTESEEPSKLTAVILRLHARGVQVAREILTLMESGFADGATARWRTLYEISVIALFISDHGEECAIQYIDHDNIAVFRGARIYQEHCENLGYEAIPSEEYEIIEKAYEECKARYGKKYTKDYGWAEQYLEGQCNFREIEKAIEVSALRPFYKYASQAIHAGPRGIFHKVGLLNQDVILFNASDYGFAEVGRNTALSLALLSSQLFSHCPVLDMVISVSIMNELSKATSESFYQTQDSMEVDT